MAVCRYLILLGLMPVILCACSALRASEAPTTPFLPYPERLVKGDKHDPWDEFWVIDTNEIALDKNVRTIYIAPVNTMFVNKRIDTSGKEVSATHRSVSDDEINNMATLIQQSFIDHIEHHPESHLRVVSYVADSDLVIEIALVELRPTEISVNAIGDVGGILLPAERVAEKALAIGGQATGGILAAGSIAIEFKVTDSKGTLVAEGKDREEDPMTLVPNYRDFERFGWSRRTAKVWAEQFCQSLSVPATEKVSSVSPVSVVPW